jgi:uncharacterized low-complexity protein
MTIVKKPLAVALGAAFLATSVAPLVSAKANPFSAQHLSGGYNLASHQKDSEGNSGGDTKAADEGSGGDTKASTEGSCGDKGAGEGSCGGSMAPGDDEGATK